MARKFPSEPIKVDDKAFYQAFTPYGIAPRTQPKGSSVHTNDSYIYPTPAKAGGVQVSAGGFLCCGAGSLSNLSSVFKSENDKALLLWYLLKLGGRKNLFFIASGYQKSQVSNTNSLLQILLRWGAKPFGPRFENLNHASTGLFMYIWHQDDVPQSKWEKYLSWVRPTTKDTQYNPYSSQWVPTFLLKEYGLVADEEKSVAANSQTEPKMGFVMKPAGPHRDRWGRFAKRV